MRLATNFAQVPDKSPPIGIGEYHADVTKVTLEEPKGKQLQRYEVTFKISDEGPEKGRIISDNFAVEHLSDLKHFTTIRLGNLLASAGYAKESLSEGVDLETLIGKSARFTVKHANSKDPTQPTTTFANVDKYLFERSAG